MAYTDGQKRYRKNFLKQISAERMNHDTKILRKDCGMQVYKIKKRNCLKCEKEFVSEGPQIRKCYECNTNTTVYGSEHNLKIGS